MSRIYIAILFVLFYSNLFSQSLSGELNINPFPSPYLSDWERSASSMGQLTIYNPSSSTEQIRLRAILSKTGRGVLLRVLTDPIALTGSPVQVISNPLSLHYSEIDFVDTETRDNVIRTGRLPEGEYSLCINIENLSGAVLASNICASLTINYPSAPQLISPENNALVDQTYPVFQWTPVTVPPRYTISYTFRLYEILSGQTPSTAIASNHPVYENTSITGTTFIYPVDAPTLETGKSYAWQVQVLDQYGTPLTQNNGKSEIFTFTKVRSGVVGNLTIVYPQNNDTIPWNYFPIIFRFDPYSDDYIKCEYTVELSENGRTLYTKNRTGSNALDWPRGPRRSQEEALGLSITEEQSQHLAINKRLNESPAPPQFNRGKNYSWSADIEIESRRRTEISGTLNGDFSVGMGRPVLNQPRDSDTLSRGIINFSFLTSNPPSRLVPPFSIVQSGGGAANFFNGGIRERWVLEVSRRSNMSEAVQVSNGFIGADLDLNSAIDNPSSAISAIYKNVNASYNANDTGWYFWRVKWLINQDDSTSNSYRESEIFRFYVRDTVTQRDTTRPTPSSCIASCEAPPITNRTAVTTARAGSDLQIGLFTMRVTEIRWTGETAEGRGTIRVPFLRAPIRVNFRNIKVNNEGRIFEGIVRAEYDNQSVVPSSLTSPGRSIASLNESEIRNLYEYVNQEVRRVTSFFGDNPIGLPIGLDKIVDGRRYTVAIVGLDFKVDKAELNAMVALDFPELHGWIGLGAKEICFHPNGLGGLGQGMLYLPNNVDLVWSSDITIRLKKTQFSDDYGAISDSGTYVKWDCSGFLSLGISGEIRFGRNLLVEDRDDGTPSSDTIIASFKTTVRRHNNWIASLTFNRPFQINGVNGFGFQIQEAWLDFSDADNPAGFNHPGGSGNNPTWKGLYLKRALFKLPSHFRSASSPSQRINFGINNLIVDRNGFTASFRSENVLNLSDGNLDGWRFSIDTIYFDMVNSAFRRAGFNGKIRTSFTDSVFTYNSVLSRDTSGEFSYNFIIHPLSRVNANIWLATLELDGTSRISVNIDRSGVSARAVLNGTMSINTVLPGIGQTRFTAMRFQGLTFLTRDPYIECPGGNCVTFGSASPQKMIAMEMLENPPGQSLPPENRSVGGFPVSISNVRMITRTNRDGSPLAGISFTINLSLMPGASNTFSASTTLNVFGRFDLTGQQRWEYHSVEVDSVNVRGSVGVVSIEGGLKFYNQDPTYGTGIKGLVDATFRPTIRARVAAQFGSKDGFNFWFFEGQPVFTPGMRIVTCIDVYGCGGGAWYKMRREGLLPNAQGLTTADTSGRGGPGGTLSGVSYRPDNNISFGFEATIVFGNTGGGQSYNADVTFNAQFTSSGGVSSMNLIGDVYFFTQVNNRRNVPVRGTATIGYDFERNIFHGLFTVNFNYTVVRGNGSVVLHFSPDTNFVHIGSPTRPITLELVIPGLPTPPQARAYFMVGNYLPDPLPPPSEVGSILGSGMSFPSRDAMITSGRGFAFGARFDANTGRIAFGPFFGRLNMGAGFDMTLQNVEGRSCEGRPSIGINNWYANGYMYAFIQGTIGLYVDIWFTRGEFKILDLSAAAALQGGLPNPIWLKGAVGGYYNILNGLVQGNCRFEFSLGEGPCIPPLESPLVNVNILTDLSPAHNSTNVDPYVNPVALFNAEINREFELEQVRDDGSRVVRRFRFLIERFELKRGPAVIPCDLQVSSDRLSAILVPYNMLEPNTNYNVTIRLKGQEYREGRWEDARNSSGQIIYAELSHDFRTGPAPNNIPPHTVAYSFPFHGQRFFLIDECRNGVVVLKQGRPDLFRTSSSVSYFIKFIPIDGGDTLTSPVEYSSATNTIRFQIPINLRTSTIYAAQIIKRFEIRVPAHIQQQLQNILGFNTRITRRGSDTLIAIRQGRIDGRITKDPNETIYYVFFFKTSRYRNLSAKVAGLSNTSTSREAGFLYDVLEARFNAQEWWDEFDVDGYSYSNGYRNYRVPPLVRTIDGLNNVWYNTFTSPVIYQYYRNLVSGGFRDNWWEQRIRDRLGVPPVNEVVTISDPLGPLSENEYLPQSTSTQNFGTTLLIGAGLFSGSSTTLPGTSPTILLSGSRSYRKIVFGPAGMTYMDYSHLGRATARFITTYGHPSTSEFIREPLKSQMLRYLNSRWTTYMRGAYRIGFRYYPFTCLDPDTTPPTYYVSFTY